MDTKKAEVKKKSSKVNSAEAAIIASTKKVSGSVSAALKSNGRGAVPQIVVDLKTPDVKAFGLDPEDGPLRMIVNCVFEKIED